MIGTFLGLIDRFLEVINSPIKSLVMVATGAVTGYLPDLKAEVTEKALRDVDTYFQHTVWSLTILVAITALITWAQKQYDRYKKLRKEKEDLKNQINDEED